VLQHVKVMSMCVLTADAIERGMLCSASWCATILHHRAQCLPSDAHYIMQAPLALRTGTCKDCCNDTVLVY
jgi:hypothetical protein